MTDGSGRVDWISYLLGWSGQKLMQIVGLSAKNPSVEIKLRDIHASTHPPKKSTLAKRKGLIRDWTGDLLQFECRSSQSKNSTTELSGLWYVEAGISWIQVSKWLMVVTVGSCQTSILVSMMTLSSYTTRSSSTVACLAKLTWEVDTLKIKCVTAELVFSGDFVFI